MRKFLNSHPATQLGKSSVYVCTHDVVAAVVFFFKSWPSLKVMFTLRFSTTPTIVYFCPVLCLSLSLLDSQPAFLLATMLPSLLREVSSNMSERIKYSYCLGLLTIIVHTNLFSTNQNYVCMYLRFQYSDLKQLLLKAYIFTRFWVFLFIFADHMLIG